jgi:PAS domain S-box-containing protein
VSSFAELDPILAHRDPSGGRPATFGSWLAGWLTGERRPPAARGLATTSRALRLPARWRYGIALAATLLAFFLRLEVPPGPGYAPFSFFFPAVALSSWLGGFGPALLSIALSAALGNYQFMDATPGWATYAAGLEATGVFLVAASTVGWLGYSLRHLVFRVERAAEALRRQSLLLELSHDAILSWSFEGGIETWNRGAEELYGYDAGEALGRTSHELLNTRSPRPWPEIEAELRERGRWEGKLVHSTKTGGDVTVSTKLQLIRAEDGTERVLETSRDVTAKEQAERALQESERRTLTRAAELRTVLDLVPAAVWIARDPNADTIDANRFGAELLEQPRGANVSVTAPPGEGPANFRPMKDGVEVAADDLPIQAAARRGLEVRDYEFDVAFTDGRVIHLLGNSAPLRDEEGRPVGSVGAFIDITERKRAEASLAASEERFRHLAEALPQMVFDLEPEGLSGYHNEQWARYTGSVPVGFDDHVALVHPDDRAPVGAAWRAAVESGSRYECEHRLRRHDGQYRWVLARALPVRDGGGGVTRWFGTLTDIHELKQSQQAMSETARLKDEFLAMLSHELRNPLAPITNSLYILDRVEPGSDQARRARAVIARQAAHLSKLVNELLDATRLTRQRIEVHREALDLNAAVGRAVEDHRNLFHESGVSLDFAPAPHPVPVSADATRLAQVVGNLLHNAVKYTPAGGHASVGVALEPDGATIRVRDDGPGIAPEVLPYLFQPFTQARQRLDRGKGGLGLGLALVKGLVELHGGSVSARSDGPGMGSEFVVHLPLDAGAAAAPAEPKPPVVVTSPRRILVVEDNPDAASSLRETLSLWGHEVAVAHDGAGAIECARLFQPEFILCDIGLPGMDGYDVARAVRADETLGDVRLIALTGYALPDDLKRAAEAGFEGHLAKPPRLDELSALLGRADRA